MENILKGIILFVFGLLLGHCVPVVKPKIETRQKPKIDTFVKVFNKQKDTTFIYNFKD